MIAALVILQELSKPEAIWAKATAKLGNAKYVRVFFETRETDKNKLVYKGSFDFVRGKTSDFEYEDLVEGCRAGADDNSTWVSPADFRGYNDTVTQRQPYFIVKLAKQVDALDSPLALDKPVKRIGVSDQIETTDGSKLLIDSRKSLVNQIEGYDTGFERVVTTFTYKKVT